MTTNQPTPIPDDTVLALDPGPVLDAARILIEQSTLGDHLELVTFPSGQVTYVAQQQPHNHPFESWGSATQELWHLLAAIAYTRHTVSLHSVVARCDSRNRAAIAAAITALCSG